jgi:putative ABC transport system substrate-binding protein
VTRGGQRLVLALLVCLIVAPPGAEPQSTTRIARIGYLSMAAAQTQYIRMVQEGLRERGWVEGQNVISEHRYAAGKVERLVGLARDLVRSKVDVIVAMETSAAHAAKEASGDIPVVFAASDPARLVGNLARPGGNLTGMTNIGTDIAGKQLELLKAIVPGATQAAALARSDSPATPPFVKEVETAARSLGLRLETLTARDPGEIDRVLRAMTRGPVDILLVQADSLFFREVNRILDFTATHRVPAMYGAREFPKAGGLVSYGTNLPALYRGLATYVDRILRGARPGDLPVEQPTKFELIINLRTAKALGLTIPQSLLLRADETIE